MVYTKYHLAILSRLYNLRCISGKHTSKENALRGLIKSDRGFGENAYKDLRKWNMIIVKPTSYGEQVSLNPQHIQDIIQLVSPNNNNVSDKPPVEDSLDARYERKAFLVTKGEKTIKGVNAIYSFHRSLADPTKVLAYVIVEGEKKSSIIIGSDNDQESLFSRFIIKCDDKFKGRPFTKPEVYKLGDDIEGNRQPPKALIDVGIYLGYLIEAYPHHYQRTNKKLPKTRIDEYAQPAVLQTTDPGQNASTNKQL